MNEFAWALAGFVAIHVGVAATGLRAVLVGALGEGGYRIGFSFLSALLLFLTVRGYGAMRADPFDPLNGALWAPPGWLHWPAAGLVALGVTLAVAGLLTPGPTLAGYEAAGLAKSEPAKGVLRITRHPFLWGVALWGAGHLLLNGERFAVMLFGALAIMAVLGARSIDRKGAARAPLAWARFEDMTSNVPFVAILQSRNRLAISEMAWRLALGVLAALGVAMLHRTAFGVGIVP